MVTLFFGVGQAIAPGIAGYMADLTGSFNLVFILGVCCSRSGLRFINPAVFQSLS